MGFQGCANALNNQAVMINGVRGDIAILCDENEDTFRAVVLLDNDRYVRFNRIEYLEALVTDQTELLTSRGHRTCARQTRNVPSASFLPFRWSQRKNIALPPIGNTPARHMYGVTGRWYPKRLCCKRDDIPLSDWIDREYNPEGRWDGEKICDQRRGPDGRIQYLVKFQGFELNLGVLGEESNEGDWFYQDQNVGQDLVRAWRQNDVLALCILDRTVASV